MPIRVAILTVSDTAATNPAADQSGPRIREILMSTEGFTIPDAHSRIVQDDANDIKQIAEQWCASGEVDWMITTGGTGFGVRDVTPEAISPLIERPAPGLVHLMLASSLKHTAFSALSRPVAGTINKTLITTLPGSVKAVTEVLNALLQGGLILHGLSLIRGDSGRHLHAQLARGDVSQTGHDHAGHHHEHHHHHGGHHHHHHEGHQHHHGEHHLPKPRSEAALSHDPSAPVTARLRKSAFPQISLDEALSLIKEKVNRLQVITLPVDNKLAGHILAEDIYALHDVPSTFTTSVDGYALRSTDAPGTYSVLTSHTHKVSDTLPPNTLYRINTGGPLPIGADTVIMVEDTELISVHRHPSNGIEEKEVKTLVQVPPFDNVRKPGSDVRKGELVMSKGDKISRGGGEIGTLAFIGKKEVKVYKKPIVAILSTGNEIVDLHAQDTDFTLGDDGWGGIYDTNRPSLTGALENLGYKVIDLGIVGDNLSAHLNALKRGLNEADILVTTGGTSMGPTDLLKPTIERYLEGVIHFGRVGAKPGKPTTFATVPGTALTPGEKQMKPIFALPGNPASALVTFYVFVVPALRRMGGWPEGACALPKIMVQIQNPMTLDPRVEFHRVVIKSTLSTPESPAEGSSVLLMKAYSTGGQRSSRATSLCKANGLVVLPPLSTNKKRLEVGELAQAMVIGEIEMA